MKNQYERNSSDNQCEGSNSGSLPKRQTERSEAGTVSRDGEVMYYMYMYTYENGNKKMFFRNIKEMKSDKWGIDTLCKYKYDTYLILIFRYYSIGKTNLLDCALLRVHCVYQR